MHGSALTAESGHSLLTLLRTMRLCLRDNLKTETLLHSSRDPLSNPFSRFLPSPAATMRLLASTVSVCPHVPTNSKIDKQIFMKFHHGEFH
jgi:hypothetical protein